MRTLQILYGFLFAFLVAACSSDEGVELNNVSTGFKRVAITVAENAGELNIPVLLEGVSKEINIDVTVTFKAINGTAVLGRDYTLETPEIQFSRSGESEVRLSLIDNDQVSGDREFKLQISSVSAGRITTKEITVTIVDDDVAVVKVKEGNYKFEGVDENGESFSASGIKLEKDADTPDKYWLRNFLDGKDIYFMVYGINNIVMPAQHVDDSGIENEAILVKIEDDGTFDFTASLSLSMDVDGVLYFNERIAAILLQREEDGSYGFYYMYTKGKLTKSWW